MSRLPSYFCWFKGLSRELTAWIPFISSNIIPNKYRIMIKNELKNKSVWKWQGYTEYIADNDEMLSVWEGLHNYNVCKGWGREILRDCQQDRPCIWTHSSNSKCNSSKNLKTLLVAVITNLYLVVCFSFLTMRSTEGWWWWWSIKHIC